MKTTSYLRFFKRFKIFSHLFLTVSRSGPGFYIRVLPGISVGFGPGGIHWAIGLPGSGLSYRTRIKNSQRTSWRGLIKSAYRRRRL